jgi:hypothetical protein
VIDYVAKEPEEEMRFYWPLLVCMIASAPAYAASDPFVGTWVYNAEKSPKPTITYKVKDLGGDRYALTGSVGNTTEIKADGVSIIGPAGEKVAFEKLDTHNWQMIRFDPNKMVRIYTVSADDKTLTLKDLFTLANGKERTTLYTYARTSPGKSIFGEWRSFSRTEDSAGDRDELFITQYEKDGLSFANSIDKDRVDMNFDGKLYTKVGPTARKGDTTSGKRVTAHLLVLDGQLNGAPEDKEEWKVSDDDKTLTIVARPEKSSGAITSVFDRK